MTTTTVGPINHQEIDTTDGVASTTALTGATATLQTNINTEATTRADADAALTAKVGAFSQFLIAEDTETLDASAAGSIIQIWGGLTVTLPESADVAVGQTITLIAISAPSTITVQGSDRIYDGENYYTSIAILPRQTISLVNRVGAEWDIYASRTLPGPVTVSQLPSSSVIVGQEAYVTDAASPAYLSTVTGGGSVVCRVMYNGTAWVCA